MIMLSSQTASDYADEAGMISVEQAGGNTQAPYIVIDDVDAHAEPPATPEQQSSGNLETRIIAVVSTRRAIRKAIFGRSATTTPSRTEP